MILDVCCGSKTMWFDKNCQGVIYGDKRQEVVFISRKCRKNLLKKEIAPDIIYDFCALPFKDNSFDLVVFDPPHLHAKGRQNTMLAKTYGVLFPGWEEYLKAGFHECLRVLKPTGTLIFKWNEYEIPTKKIIDLIEVRPLFGHKSGKQQKTHWMTFVKHNKALQVSKTRRDVSR